MSLRAVLTRLLLALALAAWALPVLATGGSYAVGGVGHYGQSLWWLDFTGFNINSAAQQNLTFTLPSGETLALGAQITSVTPAGSSSWSLTAEPAWSGGGSFGHGAYNSISGTPIFYICCGGSPSTAGVTLSSLVVKDKQNNPRNFVLIAADGENTNSPETITYTSTAAWSFLETVNPYNGGIPQLTGLGTGSVLESAPSSDDQSNNASVLLTTSNPTQVTTTFVGNEAALFALALTPVTLNVVVAGRINTADQFTGTIAYSSPLATIRSVTTSAASATTGATPLLAANGITLSVAMAAGSVSALSDYTGSMSCTNAGAGRTTGATTLPGGAGTSFTLTPQVGDAIVCTLTISPPPTVTLTPNGAQTAQPGTEVLYTQVFQAGSAGSVSFSLATSSTQPAAPAWTQVLYQDTSASCNGVLTPGDPVVSGSYTVTAGQKICLIVKQLVPAGALPGAQNALSVSAAFTYTALSPQVSTTVTASDVTTVGLPAGVTLAKLVSDVTAGGTAGTADTGKPGDTLQYTVTATNNGSGPVSTLVIYDATPAFTTFLSAACPATLPSGITACTVSAQPSVGATGSVQWTFTGSLGASAAVTVTYQVRIGS